MISRVLERLLLGFVRLYCGVQAKCPVANQTGPCVYVVNHTSHLDVVLLLCALPAPLRDRTRPVADADYWTSGFLRRYLIHSIFRGVLLERDRSGFNPLEPVADALGRGDSLILFPEGTRGPGELLLPLKPGIYYIARRSPQVDIVPLWIDNAYRILPKGSTIPVPLLCSVHFGTPLRWKPGQQEENFLAEVRAALESLQPK